MRKIFVLFICITLISCILICSSCEVVVILAVAGLIYWWDHGLCEDVGEWIEDIYPGEVIWNCHGSGDPGDNTVQHPNDNDNDGDDDYDFNDPDIVITCEGYELSSWVTVKTERDGYIWGEISLNDETQFVSEAMSLPAGIYPGINLLIPVDWEQMDSRSYDVNFYFCTDESDVYHKFKTRGRLTGLRKANISTDKLAYYRQRQADFESIFDKYNYEYCIPVDSRIDYMVVKYGTPVDSIRINRGWNAAQLDISWTLGGNKPNSAIIDPYTGRCSTLTETYVYNDLYIIATDTILGLVDTLGLHIIPDIWSYNSCTNYGFYYAKFETAVNDIDRIQAEITAKYGMPCGYYDSSASTGNAKCLSHVSIIKLDTLNVSPYGLFWAQIGHGFRKHNTSKIVDTFFYFETAGEHLPTMVYSHDLSASYPPPNSLPLYKMELKDSGKWYCEVVPGVSYTWPADSMWLTPGTILQCAGEINMWENDMCGRHGDTTVFKSIKVGIWGDPLNYYRSLPTDPIDTAHSDDFSEWGIEEFNSTGIIDSFFIWDKKPLP